ncbi:MAG: RNA methyltransferase [Candidatus Bathyarchaeia archaeon]
MTTMEGLPLKRFPKLSVAIPASLVSDVPHLREKTFKIGLIGRALAIFRIDEVIIFPDRLGEDQSREADLIATILSYMETPQYLRKFLFKIKPELRYAGVLPPLRTPHHPTQNRKKDLKVGEYREGVVVGSDTKGIFVEIGVEHPIPVPNVIIPLNTRVTVKIIVDGKHPKADTAKPEEIEVYWGYKVTISKSSLGRIIKEKTFDLVIATSRHGKLFTKVADDLLKAWKESENVLIAFGSPTEGLHDIVSKEKLKLSDVADFVINVIPKQATETVRTEEAVYATLAALNLLTTVE